MKYFPLFAALLLLCMSSCEDDTYKPTFDPGKVPGGKVIVTPSSRPSVIDGARLKGQLELADPFVFVDRKDSLYYAFGTANAQKGFKPYVSDDLQNWILGAGRAAEGFSLYKTDVTVTSGGTTYSGSDYWAPELYFYNDSYYMYYTSAEHVYVARADSPLGPFRQTSTGFTPNAKGIDNSIFVDDDGKAYMYWVRFDGGNVIYCAEMESSRTAIKSSTMKFCFRASQAWELDWGNINEGPGVIKHNGTYYMVYSGNHYQSQNYGVGVATATNPLGPWTKCSYNPILQKPGALVGTGHCAVFTDLKGDLKMIFHAHPSTAAYSPRQTYITDLSFETFGGQERLVASPAYKTLYLYTK